MSNHSAQGLGSIRQKPTNKTWQETLAPVIRDIISKVGLSNEKNLRRELRLVGPLPGSYQYKVWRQEIAFRLGKKERKKQLHPRLETNEGQVILPLGSSKKPTDRQMNILLHTLGLDYKPRHTRNHFAAYPEEDDWNDLLELEKLELMFRTERGVLDKLSPGMVYFHATEKGKRLAGAYE